LRGLTCFGEAALRLGLTIGCRADDANQNHLEAVLDVLSQFEHPLLDFSARAHGEGVQLIINAKNVTARAYLLLLTSICIRAISIIRSLRGDSSNNYTIARTITSSRCLCARPTRSESVSDFAFREIDDRLNVRIVT
jgi:hypothetical protein